MYAQIGAHSVETFVARYSLIQNICIFFLKDSIQKTNICKFQSKVSNCENKVWINNVCYKYMYVKQVAEQGWG